MAFKSKFNADGLPNELNILGCSYELQQEIDATGRPSSITRGGTITVTVESSNSTFFYAWMTDNFDRKNGTITYTKRDTDAKMKQIKFTEGYLVRYKETFDSTGTNPLTETFTISARELSMEESTHINEWV